MTRTTGPPAMITVGLSPAIWCPVCGKNAVAVEYDGETGVAEYVHVYRQQDKRHSVKLGT